MLLLGVRLREDERELRVVAHADPLLLAGDAPPAVRLLGAGAEVGGVGAGVRLGETEAAQDLAAAELRKPLVLLVLAAPALDRGADEARLDRDDGPRGRVATADLLHDQSVGAVVEPAAAVLLGHDRPEVAHVAELLDELGVEALVAVVLASDRHDLLVGEVAGRLLDEALLVGEFEI